MKIGGIRIAGFFKIEIIICRRVLMIFKNVKEFSLCTAIKKVRTKPNNTIFSILVAPSIHADTRYMVAFSKHQYNVDILTLTISEFIDQINVNKHIVEMLSA